MIAWLRQYKKSAIFAMSCGLVTMLLGILAFPGFSMSALLITMVLNTVLHYESYVVGLLTEKRKQGNVLAMAIAETVLLTFFAVTLWHPEWKELIILFSVYLVFNGTSLIAIPSTFARYCGIAATVLGAVLFYFGQEAGALANILVGINLIVNGGERVVMTILGGKKKK